MLSCVSARVVDEGACQVREKTDAFRLNLHKQHSKAGLLNLLRVRYDRTIEKLDTLPLVHVH